MQIAKYHQEIRKLKHGIFSLSTILNYVITFTNIQFSSNIQLHYINTNKNCLEFKVTAHL